MISMLHDSRALAILAASALAFVLSRTRLASGTLLAAAAVVVLAAEASAFDGQRHLTSKFDASFFVWARAVELRALAGLAVLAVAAPTGVVAGRYGGARRGATLGMLALGPFGGALVASSVVLQLAMRRAVTHEPVAERYALLADAIGASTAILAAGTVASVAVLLALALMLARRGERA